jgi:hypothetical protein
MDIKKKVFTGQSIALEAYSEDVSNRSILSPFDVKAIYRNMLAMKKYVKNPVLSQNKRTMWDSSEDNVIIQYYKLASKEIVDIKGVKKRRTQYSIFADLVDVLQNRTESSIPFRYRQLIADKSKNKPKTKGLSIVQNTPINKPVESTSISMSAVTPVEAVERAEKDDLLDIVVDTIDNLDTAGVDITDLFKSILKLSKSAVENSNVEKVNALDEANQSLEEQVRVLKGRNSFLEGELLKEQERSQKLQDDLNKFINEIGAVWKEIDQFERLTGKQKLKQINSHSTRMKYIVGQFGNVDVVAN